jgi:hypothetical protein
VSSSNEWHAPNSGTFPETLGSVQQINGRYLVRIKQTDFSRLVHLTNLSEGTSLEPEQALYEMTASGLLTATMGRVYASDPAEVPIYCIDVTHWAAPNGTVNYLAAKTRKVSGP